MMQCNSFLKKLIFTMMILSALGFQAMPASAMWQSAPKTAAPAQSADKEKAAKDQLRLDPRIDQLIQAARERDTRRIEKLLKAGVNADSEDRLGETAMGEACAQSDRSMVELLLKNGADINHQTKKGTTPLMAGALYASKEFVAFLIKKGADVNLKAKDGQTALMAAAMHGQADIIKLLIEKGAKVNDEDKDHFTALTFALRADNHKAADALKAAGGTSPPVEIQSKNEAAISVVDRRPKPLNAPEPEYTQEARRNHVEGIVIARVLVGPDGKVKQVRITRGLPDGLDDRATFAASRLRFEPAIKGGQAVAFWVTVQIEFHLRR
jgi:TonB family protein